MLFSFTSTNPCICSSTTNVPTDPGCPEDCNCIKLCHITVNANSSSAVGPCGKEGTIDVEDAQYGHDLCACDTNDTFWSVESFDEDRFASVTIDHDGILTWVTAGSEALSINGGYGCAVLRMACGELSALVMVIIGIKDICDTAANVGCDNCDPCSGNCLDGVLGINATGS